MYDRTHILALCTCGKTLRTKLIHETAISSNDVAIIIEVKPCKVCLGEINARLKTEDR